MKVEDGKELGCFSSTKNELVDPISRKGRWGMMKSKLISCVFLVLIPACSAFGQEGTSTLSAGGTLKAGQRLVSPQKTHYLVIQADDGNLCIYTNKDVFVWGSMVTKGSDSYLTMQDDGNLVVHDRNNQAVWATDTQAFFDAKYGTREWRPVRAVLQDDGTLELFTAANKRVWSSAVSQSMEGFTGPTTKQDLNITLPFAKGQKLTVEVANDGTVIFQRDMILGKVSDFTKSDPPSRDADSWIWPNSTIPYVIEAGHGKRDVILAGIKEIDSKTNLCLVPRTTQTDYVEFVSRNGHHSAIGRVGGRQEISIDQREAYVPMGTVAHEILHACGFQHTQSREDRDKHVRINSANIRPGMEHNFEKLENKAFNIGAYDYGSIMHYSSKAFSLNGKNTIDVNGAGDGSVMGNRKSLSASDIAAVASVYAPGPCLATTPAPSPNALSTNATPPSAATLTKSTAKQGEPKVDISVTNKTGQPLEVHWVDYQGKEGKPGAIKADAENFKMGFSYPGNLYRFKIKGQLVHSWMITKEQPHLVIGLPSNTLPTTPSVGAKATPPSAATLTRSTAKQGEPKVDIFVTNKTGQPLEVHWVDYQGKEGKPGTIKADAENFKMGFSYPGNLYRFKIQGRLVHSWMITKEQPHLIIE